jgi:hypothetical protein
MTNFVPEIPSRSSHHLACELIPAPRLRSAIAADEVVLLPSRSITAGKLVLELVATFISS